MLLKNRSAQASHRVWARDKTNHVDEKKSNLKPCHTVSVSVASSVCLCCLPIRKQVRSLVAEFLAIAVSVSVLSLIRVKRVFKMALELKVACPLLLAGGMGYKATIR